MKRWVTGSSLDRALLCPGSTVLPQTADRESPVARHGKKVHADLEAGRLPAGMDPEWYPPGGSHEIQCWFDPATSLGGFRLGGVGRDYSWAPARFIVGTLDYVHRGKRWVDDLKTGLLLPALDTLQLGLGAVALHDEEGPGDIRVSLTSAPRTGLPPRRYTRTLQPLDVDAIRETLLRLRGQQLLQLEGLEAGVQPTVNPGSHCKYCRAVCEKRAA